jgi:hypothetical protein
MLKSARVTGNPALTRITPTSAYRPKCLSICKRTDSELWARLAQLVSALGHDRKVTGLKPGLDSDHSLSPITINWFAGVNIMWLAASNFGVCGRKAITKTKLTLTQPRGLGLCAVGFRWHCSLRSTRAQCAVSLRWHCSLWSTRTQSAESRWRLHGHLSTDSQDP